MELRHLQYFVAVAEEENVTRAAVRLYISQPPLTRQIHDLEEELGVELFRRKGRSLSLTRAGKLFLTEAREILEKVDSAVACLRTEAHGRSTILEIGYAPSPTAGVLPELLRSFRNAHPDTRVNLHDCSSPEMLEGLNNRCLDVAFMVKQRPQLLRGLSCRVIATFPLGVAIPRDHKWARRKMISEKTF